MKLDEVDKKKIKIMKKVEKISSFRKRKRTLIGDNNSNSNINKENEAKTLRSNTILN